MKLILIVGIVLTVIGLEMVASYYLLNNPQEADALWKEMGINGNAD